MQIGYPLVVGSTLAGIVWALYFVRITLGIGPMYDYDGNQAPAWHYLAGALTVTAMVAAWIAIRAMMTRRQR